MNSDTSLQAGGMIRASGLSEQEGLPPLITTPAVEAQRAGAALHSETRVPHQLQEGAEGSFTWGAYFQAIGILIALLALFWLVLRLIRKVGAGRFLPACCCTSGWWYGSFHWASSRLKRRADR